MQKLLFQFDTDPQPSAFDIVTAYDAGADHVVSYGSITPENVQALVHGCIFTRGGDDLRKTAIWVGGRDIDLGQQVLGLVTKSFFGGFRVSVMLDSNGANTTAATAVAQVTKAIAVQGARVVVAAGTGAVGIRTAGLFAREGARVVITSPRQEWLDYAAGVVTSRFEQTVETALVANEDTEGYRAVLEGARILFGAGPAGVRVVPLAAWQESPTLAAVVDLNLAPPAGVEGVEPGDKGADRFGKQSFGALGVGNRKMKVHKACVASLFEQNDRVLDVEAIYQVARKL